MYEISILVVSERLFHPERHQVLWDTFPNPPKYISSIKQPSELVKNLNIHTALNINLHVPGQKL